MTGPRFSIVIPTHARPGRITACLETVAALDYPCGCFEVIIVDDGSPSSPGDEVEAFQDRINVRLVRQENVGPGGARNFGAESATGEFLAFTADDCRVHADWLARLAEAFEQNPDHLLGGRIEHGLPTNAYSTASHLLIDFMYRRYNRDPQRATFFTPNNMAIPRADFLELGGFDATTGRTGEDRELCRRWLDGGRGMAYVEAAVVTHVHPLSATKYLRQQHDYGVGSAKHRKRLRARGGESRRGTPEPLTFYANLVFHPLRYNRGPRGWGHVALMFAGQVANALGVAREKFLGPPAAAAK